MLLKHKLTGKIIEIVDLYELTNPFDKQLVGCLQWAEQVPDPECFDKIELCFPSDEELPRCWLDERFNEEHYAEDTQSTHQTALESRVASL